MDIKYELKDSKCTVYFENRVDTNNAKEVEDKVLTILSENNADSVVIDAADLVYISSAGLRVVLKIKKLYKNLRVVNVIPDVYDVFEMTGFTEMIDIEKAYKNLDVSGCEVIGKGAKGTVYRYDPETVVKVYINPDSLDDILNERKLARKAFVLGIPTAISYDIVKVGESYGSVFELISSKTYSELIKADPDNIDKYVAEFTTLLKTIHSTDVTENDMGNIKDTIYQWIEVIKGHVSDENVAKITEMVDKVPNVMKMLHCDYHTNNVLLQNDETILIDMDTLSYGHPIFELANIYITYVGFGVVDNSVVEKFIGLPYDLACKFWDVFIRQYFEGKSEEEIAVIEAKVQLLSNVRLLRHIARRGINNDVEAQTVEYAKNKINELVEKVDTLEF